MWIQIRSSKFQVRPMGSKFRVPGVSGYFKVIPVNFKEFQDFPGGFKCVRGFFKDFLGCSRHIPGVSWDQKAVSGAFLKI